MQIKKIEDYKYMKYRSFPSERGETHQMKEKDWFLAYCQSILHRYVSGSTVELSYNSKHLIELEKYAKGTQGNRKVKEKLLRYNKETGKFKGRMKDVFQTLDILPEMIDVILSTNMKSDYKPQSLAVDEDSVKDKNMEISMAKFLVEEKTKEFLKYMGVKVDSPLTDEELSILTGADVEVLYQSGGIKMQRELACVSVCNTAMLHSYHKEIENLNSFDSITYGICATKTYWDYSSNIAAYRYVDIKNLIIPRSKYNDFRDITYAAEVRLITLAEVLRECPDMSSKDLQDLITCNHKFNSDFNAAYSDLEGFIEGNNDIFDEYRVAVVDAEWLATDVEVHLQSTTRNGSELYKKVDPNTKLKPSQERRGQKLENKSYIRKYDAIWVIGTDILLKYGKSTNVKYKGKKNFRIPRLSYSIAKTGKKSIVDRCRTIVDDINLAVCKLRSSIATLPPAPRMVIYDQALQNIKFNGILQKPRDLFDGFSEDGVLVVNGLDSKGRQYTANGGKAVEFMNSGLAEDISIFSNEIIQKINMMRQVIGLPEGLDGTAGQKYQLASTMNLAAAASSNALFPTTSLIGPLFEGTFDKVVSLTQLQCRDSDLTVEEIGLSERVVNVFKIGKDFSNYEFKIRMLFVPTESEREFLLNKLAEASAMYTQTEGKIGISQAEFLMLYKLIKAGLIDEAMMSIARIEGIRTKGNIAAQQAAIQEAAQQAENSARVAEEEKRQSKLVDEAAKRETVTLEQLWKGINDLLKISSTNSKGENGQYDVNKAEIEAAINTNKILISNIVDKDQQILNPAPVEEQMV